MWTELLLLPYSFQKSQLITILSPGLRYLDLTKEEATDSFQVRLQSVFGSMLLVLHKSGNAIAVVASFIISKFTKDANFGGNLQFPFEIE